MMISHLFLLVQLLTFAVILLSTLVVAPFVVGIAGRAVGWYLQWRGAPRRAQILERVRLDEEMAADAGGSSKKAEFEDLDWEKVEAHQTQMSKNGKPEGKDWEGIVGFFHPFW